MTHAAPNGSDPAAAQPVPTGGITLEKGEDGFGYLTATVPPLQVRLALSAEQLAQLGEGMGKLARDLRPGLGLTIASELPPAGKLKRL